MPASRSSRLRISAICLAVLLTAAVVAWAQGRKPGLWESTSVMTLQQSPFPAGMTPPAASPLAGGPHTSQSCLTQEIIDKYGAPAPQSRDKDCAFSNVHKGDHGMTADMVCSGRMNGKGTLKSEWSDPEHAKGTLHFTGTVQGRSGVVPLEWTSEYTSVFKSADCGDVKPVTGN